MCRRQPGAPGGGRHDPRARPAPRSCVGGTRCGCSGGWSLDSSTAPRADRCRADCFRGSWPSHGGPPCRCSCSGRRQLSDEGPSATTSRPSETRSWPSWPGTTGGTSVSTCPRDRAPDAVERCGQSSRPSCSQRPTTSASRSTGRPPPAAWPSSTSTSSPKPSTSGVACCVVDVYSGYPRRDDVGDDLRVSSRAARPRCCRATIAGVGLAGRPGQTTRRSPGALDATVMRSLALSRPPT